MSSTERASKLPSPTPYAFEPISEFSFRLRCRFLASSSQLSGQYSDIAEGKPVTLSMAIDSIQALQRQLSDVEKKASTSGRIGGEGRGYLISTRVEYPLTPFTHVVVHFPPTSCQSLAHANFAHFLFFSLIPATEKSRT